MVYQHGVSWLINEINIKDYYVKVYRMLPDSNKNIFLASTIKSLHVRYTDRRKAGGAG